MKKATKIWLIIATFLIILGSIMFTAVLADNNWDFSKTGSVKYETNTYEIGEDFDNISINTETTDIIFKYHSEKNCKVVLFEEEKIKHFAKVEDKTLKIGETDTREWFDYIQLFSFKNTSITVYLPRENYLSLNIDTDTSDIKIPKEFKFRP